jgi:hypothetical protein
MNKAKDQRVYLYIEESIVRKIEKDELKNSCRERRVPITQAIADILCSSRNHYMLCAVPCNCSMSAFLKTFSVLPGTASVNADLDFINADQVFFRLTSPHGEGVYSAVPVPITRKSTILTM